MQKCLAQLINLGQLNFFVQHIIKFLFIDILDNVDSAIFAEENVLQCRDKMYNSLILMRMDNSDNQQTQCSEKMTN